MAMAAPSPDSVLVAVIGLGGVGSHCAHALVRAGVRQLRLVDFDRVSLSSLNRHAVATRRDVGIPKVLACAQHFCEIAPGCEVDARDEMFTAAAAASLLGDHPRRPTLVVDCIDDVPTKADLLAFCVSAGLPVISALGSGCKSDPTQLCVSKGLRDIENDALATKLRKVFASRDTDLSGVSFVYSSQRAQKSLLPLTEEQRQKPEEFGNVANFRLRVLPVLGTQPAIAGVALATQTLLELGIGRHFCPRPAPAPRRALVDKLLEQLRKKEGGSRSGSSSRGVDVTLSEATYLVHEVWRCRSALNTDQAIAGASGLKFTMAPWDALQPVTAGNLILATEDEAEHHLSAGCEAHALELRRRVSTALSGALACLFLPSAQALQVEPGVKSRRDSSDPAKVLPQPSRDAASRDPSFAAASGDEASRTEEEAALVSEQLSRSSAFLGADGHARIRRAFVVIVGAGSAGSAAAALLVRAGVGRLRLIDAALVEEGGNHMVAAARDVGTFKVEACCRSLSDVLHGAVKVEGVPRHFEEVAAKELLGLDEGPPDLVLDCTGDLASKAEVLSAAAAHGLRAVIVVATPGLVDPTRIVTTPLAEVYASPAAALLRERLVGRGVASGALERVDVVHSQEAGHWLELPSGEGPGSHLLRFAMGLAAAAVAVHRLVGETPQQAAAPGTVSAWKKLRRGLAQREGLEPLCKELPDVHTIGCVAEQVWRGRSALSRSAGARPSEAQAGLVVARWDRSRPLDIWNLVLLTEDEGEAHAAACEATGSLPRTLLEALGRGPLLATPAPAEDSEAEPRGLLDQQLRAHFLLQRLKVHLAAVSVVSSSTPSATSAPPRRSPCLPHAARTLLSAPSYLKTLVAARPSVAPRWLGTFLAMGGIGFLVAMARLCAKDVEKACRIFRRIRQGPLHLALGAIIGALAKAWCKRLWGTCGLRWPRTARGGGILNKDSAVMLPVASRLPWPSIACGDGSADIAGFSSDTASLPGGFMGLVGSTPLVELKRLSQALGCRILAKAEFVNPGGCQKDRVAQSIVEEAESSGLLRPGGTIVEGTSGSTGISLSLAAACKGYKVHIVMPDDQASEKVQLLKRFGAEVELVRPASISNPEHYVNVARRRAAEICENHGPGAAIFADQFENPANFLAHYRGTGPELWAQCGQQLDAFVMSAGTGGTLAGVARYLKEVGSKARIYLADVSGSSLYNKVAWGVLYASEQAEQTVRRHRTDTIAEGIGIDRLTANFAQGLPSHNGGSPGIDCAVRVSDQEALDMAYYLLAHEGLFVGSSAAVNCAAAVKVARQLPAGSVVATVLCDGGQRHVTKFYNPSVWEDFGLVAPVTRERGDVSFIH
eukprot:CAMPEP_0203922284 /NCGR_PEP_ID=MMETSP0359-20131031/62324_1 /ASSEMBLY_ACC=CAM_ASM_000338 /TAXON_ID=268821 /ORGANISM="Scrippsiella Hangoei, Strain SHTV-5" /LENGTH=1343 /DNA_ID=CAMNT_0050850125 /DNA_START=1 /DNA_END=4032 /DNA_ORIENTATION=+